MSIICHCIASVNIFNMSARTSCPCPDCHEDRAVGWSTRQALALSLVGLGRKRERRCLYTRVKQQLEEELLAREKSLNPR